MNQPTGNYFLCIKIIMEKYKQLLVKLIVSKTARNVYLTSIGNALYTFFTFVFFVLIAPKALGPEEFGRLSALFAFVVLLADLTDAGLGASLSRFLPPLMRQNKNQEVKKITKAAFVFQLIVATILGIVVFLCAPLLSRYVFDQTNTALVAMTSFGIVAIVLFGFANFLYSARQEFITVATIASVVSGVLVIGALLLLSLNQFTLTSALLLLVLPGFLCIIPLIVSSQGFLSVTVRKKDWWDLFSFSKYLGVNKIFTAVATRIDILLLSAFLGSFEVGIYSAAFRITQVYQLIMGSLSTVFAPRFAVYHSVSEAKGFVSKVILVTGAVLISVLLFFITAHPFITLLFGDKYARSIPIFRALLIPTALFVLQLPFNGLILYTLKKPQIFMMSSIVQLIMTLTGTIFFIRFFGVYGPVIGLSLGYGSSLCMMMIGLWYFRKT